MNKANLYIPFAKKDNDKRIVEGYASTEALDSQGEIVKFEAIEKALPDYMKFGNIREMHQPSAVGKTVKASVDREKRGLWLVAKIVDKDAWGKVKEGVYNGFSIGGRVLKRAKNTIKEVTLTEISIVDRPANPEAVFAMIKFDGEGEMIDMQKDLDMDTDQIMTASIVLDLARQMRMMIHEFEFRGRSTKELEKALTILKGLARTVLNEEEHKKFEKILYSFSFEEADAPAIPKGIPLSKDPDEQQVNVKKYINRHWSGGYFEQAKKVLG